MYFQIREPVSSGFGDLLLVARILGCLVYPNSSVLTCACIHRTTRDTGRFTITHLLDAV